jgi:hypothetical protein
MAHGRKGTCGKRTFGLLACFALMSGCGSGDGDRDVNATDDTHADSPEADEGQADEGQADQSASMPPGDSAGDATDAVTDEGLPAQGSDSSPSRDGGDSESDGDSIAPADPTGAADDGEAPDTSSAASDGGEVTDAIAPPDSAPDDGGAADAGDFDDAGGGEPDAAPDSASGEAGSEIGEATGNVGGACGAMTCADDEYCEAPCSGIGFQPDDALPPPRCMPLPAACNGVGTCECICGETAGFCTPGSAEVQCGCG